MGIQMKNGQFVIDGKPRFLYGGEFHYYRCPKGEWADRLDRLKEAGCNLVSTYIPWVWHEPTEGEVDLTGETRPEKDLQSFLELIAEKELYCIVRPGPYVMAEVRLEGIPPWIHDDYPEVVALQKDGRQHPNRIVSYLHPVFLEKVAAWYGRVCDVIVPFQKDRGGPVILFQLCNEIGMLHWVSNTSDYNPVVLKRFQEYLAEKYGSMEGLNNAYGTSFADMEAFVQSAVLKGQQSLAEKLHWEWGRFWRQQIRDYVDELKGIAQAYGIHVPYLINVHGFKDFSVYSRGVDYPIGLSQLYRTPEVENTVLAGDFYPGHIGYDTYHDLVLASALTKAVSQPGQPLFSAEFQSGRLADRPRVYPQDLDLNARTCIAHGMNAINWYMFVAGENFEDIGLFGRRHEWQAPVDSDGNPRRSFTAARHIGRLLQANGDKLLCCTKRIDTHLAFYPDYYMTETVERGTTAGSMVSELAGERERFFFDGIGRLLTAANLHFEAVDVLAEDRIDPEAVNTLWMFSGERMDEGVQRKLVRYVEEGGKLILYPRPPVKNLDGNPCTILVDSLDIPQWKAVHGIETARVLEIDSVKVDVRLEFGKVPGTPIAWDRFGEKAAGFVRAHGKGAFMMLGLGLAHDYNYQLDVIRAIAGSFGIRPSLTSSNPDLSLTERSDGKTSFLFIHNYDEITQQGVIYREGEPLFGGKVLTVAPRSGVMLPVCLPLWEGLTVDYSTMEILSFRREEEKAVLELAFSGETGEIAFSGERGVRVNNGSQVTSRDGKGSTVVRFTGEPGSSVTLELYLETGKEKV
ncbi:glycoside hydrolase [Marinithermofilum abyssi]|uniref:Glycoside hydrolase n=1 Tax=Marinithermofilum abyssi TaxID=1571185 RepID=A0A8J2YBI9_9BACL|nr:beta-galactosidase [Marinithermofilum abyssi]GGE03900.1 glycoside hydrolase [Marinithermofilum abyssi]